MSLFGSLGLGFIGFAQNIETEKLAKVGLAKVGFACEALLLHLSAL